MPKLDLTSVLRASSASGRILQIKGAGFTWTAPVTTPDPNTAPVVYDIESTSLSVEWQLPYNGGSPITRTVLQYRTASPVGPATIINDLYGPVTIIDLTPSTSYQVRVRSDNAIGGGTFSPWVTESTVAA